MLLHFAVCRSKMPIIYQSNSQPLKLVLLHFFFFSYQEVILHESFSFNFVSHHLKIPSKIILQASILFWKHCKQTKIFWLLSPNSVSDIKGMICRWRRSGVFIVDFEQRRLRISLLILNYFKWINFKLLFPVISLENHCLNSFDIPKHFVTLNESANLNVTVRLHFLSLVSKYRFVFRSWFIVCTRWIASRKNYANSFLNEI